MRTKKPPKPLVLYDLHEVYWAPYMESGVRKFSSVPRWVSTPVRNQPYTIVNHKRIVLQGDKKYPPGTKFISCKNGQDVIKMIQGHNS